MKKLELDEIKRIELKLLVEIDAICKKDNINYSICGGTLLGAIRHKGFIPWDDDIDIMMPRDDYEKFLSICNSSDCPFNVVSNQINNKYGYLFAKAMAKNTNLFELNGNRHGIDLGVFVDIFPIDYLGSSRKEAVKNWNKTRFLRELLVARNWTRFFRSKTKPIIYEPIRFAFFFVSRFFSEKYITSRIEKKIKTISGSCSKEYCGCICGSYRERDIYESSIFNSYVSLTFEDREFMAIAGFETYLKQLYNDYMQLPPESKRFTHHTFDAFLNAESED